MIDSRLDIRHSCLSLVVACLLASSSPVFARQDAEQDTDTAETGETPPAVAAEKAKAKKKIEKAPNSKNRYFLGARPNLKRQQGPAIGKPANILPQPYVPVGSVEVPAAPSFDGVPEVTGEPSRETLSADTLGTDTPGADALGTDIGDAGGLPADPSSVDVQQTALLQETAVSEPASGFPQNDTALEAGALERIDPSGVTVGSIDAPYLDGFWQGYDRAGVIKRLAEFSETSGSPSLVQIANKIALSGAVFEGTASDAEILAFLEARLQLLMQMGNREGYRELLTALPTGYDWSLLSRHFTNVYLLDGKLGDACALAKERREVDNDAYWLRMVAFCEAAHGNRNGVDFQLRILEEVSDVRPTFYLLIDRILVEAEQPPGAVLPAKANLPASLRIDVLEATMARLARIGVPELALDGVNPIAIDLMLSLPGVTQEAKTALMGFAVRRGWANGDLLAAFIRSLKADTEEEDAALLLQSEDDRFEIDAILTQMAAKPAPISERAAALGRAWSRALKNSYTGVAGESLLALSDDLEPNAAGGSVMARAALVAGKADEAARWFLTLRSQAAGADAQADTALVSIAPLMTIANIEGVPSLDPALLSRWWQGENNRVDRFERANMLFTLIEALGGAIGDEAWGWLEDGPVAFGGTVPAPAQWRRFLVSARDGDTPKALAYAFRLLSEGGTAAVPASLAGSIVGTIDGMGLKAEARMLATEILISQGL